jgi:hypothetical protein
LPRRAGGKAELQARLERKDGELEPAAQISGLPPVILDGVLVVPMGLIALMSGKPFLPWVSLLMCKPPRPALVPQ